jgi:hypothetical protein
MKSSEIPKMLREEANHGNSIFTLAVGVKYLRSTALDLFAVLDKLALPLRRLRAPFSRDIIQCHGANTALDLSICVKHGEPEKHPVNVVSKRFAPPECHCNAHSNPTIKMPFEVVERLAA